MSLLPGAEDMVAAAAARAPVALASSAPRMIIDTVMDSMALRRYFRATVSSAGVPSGKPAPDVYAEAAARLGIDPAQSLAVEDSSNGVRSASAAGFTVLVIEHEQYPLAVDAVATAIGVYHSPAEILEQLEKLLGHGNLLKEVDS